MDKLAANLTNIALLTIDIKNIKQYMLPSNLFLQRVNDSQNAESPKGVHRLIVNDTNEVIIILWIVKIIYCPYQDLT